jgi:hypothetical protein
VDKDSGVAQDCAFTSTGVFTSTAVFTSTTVFTPTATFVDPSPNHPDIAPVIRYALAAQSTIGSPGQNGPAANGFDCDIGCSDSVRADLTSYSGQIETACAYIDVSGGSSTSRNMADSCVAPDSGQAGATDNFGFSSYRPECVNKVAKFVQYLEDVFDDDTTAATQCLKWFDLTFPRVTEYVATCASANPAVLAQTGLCNVSPTCDGANWAGTEAECVASTGTCACGTTAGTGTGTCGTGADASTPTSATTAGTCADSAGTCANSAGAIDVGKKTKADCGTGWTYTPTGVFTSTANYVTWGGPIADCSDSTAAATPASSPTALWKSGRGRAGACTWTIYDPALPPRIDASSTIYWFASTVRAALGRLKCCS